MALGHRHLPPHMREANERARPSKFLSGLVLIVLAYMPPIGAKLGWSGVAESWSEAGNLRWAFLPLLLLGCYSVVYYRKAVRIPEILAGLIALAAVGGFVFLILS